MIKLELNVSVSQEVLEIVFRATQTQKRKKQRVDSLLIFHQFRVGFVWIHPLVVVYRQVKTKVLKGRKLVRYSLYHNFWKFFFKLYKM